MKRKVWVHRYVDWFGESEYRVVGRNALEVSLMTPMQFVSLFGFTLEPNEFRYVIIDTLGARLC